MAHQEQRKSHQSLKEKNQIIIEQKIKIDDLIEETARLNSQIIRARTEFLKITHSTSWRLTRPMRVIARKTKIPVKIVTYLIKNLKNPGIQSIFFKMKDVFKHEGMDGIKREIFDIWLTANVSARNNYTKWLRRYSNLNIKTRKTIINEINGMPTRPKLSIIMPVYNPPIDFLDKAIKSVRNQLYPDWELCIADDASTNADVCALLKRHASQDARIHVTFRTENGHISAASNSALELATGEFIVLLDHDDLLPEDAIFWIARTINSNHDAQLIYSDEDKVDAKGTRYDPYFKPDWNPELFLSQNYISHLGVYKTTLIRKIGGFRLGFEGSQDYDLALRCTELIKHSQIIHIPKVLYHWRSHADSTALSADCKSYAYLNGLRALNEHLARRCIPGKAKYSNCGYRVHYTLPESPPLVSIIIPTRDALELIRQCISSILLKTSYSNYEILIIDNNSNEPATIEYFKQVKTNSKIRIIKDDQPFNYSALNNAAVKLAAGDLICLLNNDTEVISPDWLTEMVSLAINPEIGAVGAKLLYPASDLQHGGVICGIGGIAGHSHRNLLRDYHGYFGRASLISNFSAVTAACLLIRKTIYTEVNGLNEVHLKVDLNDIDFCLRIKEAGYHNVWTPYAELYHHESATRGTANTPEKQKQLSYERNYIKEHWGHILTNDPAYNKNLTLNHEDFSLAWPPRN